MIKHCITKINKKYYILRTYNHSKKLQLSNNIIHDSPCTRHLLMHWPISTLVSYLVPLIMNCTCSADTRLLPLSRGAHVQFIALMMSCRPFKFLIVVTSEGEAMQRFVPRQTCFREKVMGGTRWVFFFIITTTTASFVPNLFFTTDYQDWPL